MKDLMTSNIYELKDKIVVCGTCLQNMDKKAFKELENQSKNIFSVCLENTHMNMATHKITSAIRTGNIKEIIFASVDGSPHCIQLHYIAYELNKIFPNKIKLNNYVANKGKLIKISLDKIAKSKRLLEQ